jgi:hypothetical protein
MGKKKRNGYHEMEVKTWFNCEHVFTPLEREEKSTELVKSHQELNTVLAKRKIDMDRYGQRQKEINKNINDICLALTEGKETKSVECVVRFNEDLTHKYVVHPENGEVVYDAPLDIAEQAEIKDAWEEVQKKAALSLQEANKELKKIAEGL